MLQRSNCAKMRRMTISAERIYFSVLDEEGNALPAVEYWAAVVEEGSPVYEGLALRRFVKLIGPNEPLEQVAPTRFEGRYSGRTYTTLHAR